VLSADYYDILGIPKTADEKEIKRAYHQKAMELHPDRNKNDPKAQEKFQELHKAYTTLSNKKKRRIYDQMGSENYERMETGSGDGSSGFQGDVHAEMQSVWEHFSKAFGGGAFGFGFGSPGAHDFFRGGGGFSRMMMQEVRLSFMEAVKGTKKKLRFDVDTSPIEVEFPAGIDNGQQILVDAGDSSQIILTVTVERHPIFQRRALDIFVNRKIDMVDAALGGSIEIPTLDGDTEISVNEGTQNGDKLRLKGKGVRVGHQRGDLYVIVSVVIPSRLTSRQKQLLLEFSREERMKKAA